MELSPYYLNILCSPHGGISTYVLGLIQAQCYHHQSVGLAYNKRHSDHLFTRKVSLLQQLNKNDILNLTTHKVPSLGTFGDILSLYLHCHKLSVSRGLVLIAHGTSSAGLALFIKCLLPGTKFYYIPHGGLSHLYNSSNYIFRVLVWLFDFLLSSCGARYLCESRSTFRLYSSLNSSRFYPRFNLQGYTYSLPVRLIDDISITRSLDGSLPPSRELTANEPFKVVYLGTWRRIKGSIHLLNVLSQMNSSQFVLPDGRALQYLFYTDFYPNDLTSKLPQGLDVTFHSWASDVPSILSSCDVQIIPSMGESFGYAAVEALVARLPVIHTCVGGLQEVLGETDMPVIPTSFTPSDLYQAILQVYNSSFNDLLAGSDPLSTIAASSFWNSGFDLDNQVENIDSPS